MVQDGDTDTVTPPPNLDNNFSQVKPLKRQTLKDTWMQILVNQDPPISLVNATKFSACLEMGNPQKSLLMCKRECLTKGILQKSHMMK